jgi:hypothetical protein
MVELLCLGVVWLSLSVGDKLRNPEERGDLVVWAGMAALFVLPILISVYS